MRGDLALAGKDRARRFELQIPLRYRVNGGSHWRRGIIKNISSSGVLFQGEDWTEPSTPVEISFVLPNKMPGEGAAEVVCRGTVMRSERSGNDADGSLFATTISSYRFVRP